MNGLRIRYMPRRHAILAQMTLATVGYATYTSEMDLGEFLLRTGLSLADVREAVERACTMRSQDVPKEWRALRYGGKQKEVAS
jgi:hypothetical protein